MKSVDIKGDKLLYYVIMYRRLGEQNIEGSDGDAKSK